MVTLTARDNERKDVVRVFILVFFCALFFYAISVILFLGFGRDTENYRNFYESLSVFDESNFIWIEPGFLLIAYLLKAISFPFESFIAFFLLVIVSFKVSLICKVSRNAFVSVMYYLSWFLLLHDSTQIRLAAAVTFLMLSLIALSKGHYGRYLALVCAGTLFHYSALLFLFILPFRILAERSERVPLLIGMITLLSFVIAQAGGIAGRLVDFLAQWIPGVYFFHKLSIYKDAGGAVGLLSFKNLFVLTIIWSTLLLYRKMKLTELEVVSLLSITTGFTIYALFLDFEVLSVRGSEIFLFPIIFLMPAFLRAFKQKMSMFLVISLFPLLILSYYLFHIELFEFYEM